MTTVVAPPRHRAPSALRAAIPSVAAAAAVALAALSTLPLLVAVVVVVQISAAAGVLLLADAPGRRQSAVLAAVAAVVSDVLAVRQDGERIGDLVAVVALSLVAAVLLELLRRHRSRVTESLAAAVTSVILVVLAAHLLTMRVSSAGPRVVALSLGGVAVGLLAGGLVELLVRGPQVVSGSRRGVLGVLATSAAAAGFGALAGGPVASVSVGAAVGLVVAAAAAAAVGGLLVDLACADATPVRRRAAATPLGAALPVVLAAPVAFAVSRLVIG